MQRDAAAGDVDALGAWALPVASLWTPALSRTGLLGIHNAISTSRCASVSCGGHYQPLMDGGTAGQTLAGLGSPYLVAGLLSQSGAAGGVSVTASCLPV
jgi:hypothetical protein